MHNNKDLGPSHQFSKSENQGAKLSAIAAAILALGYALETVSATLELEEAKNNHDKHDMKNMQKQIDYLNNELRHLKRKMR
ncbi:hypothetical protein [Solibacillus sp. CAU 1738]|uniref:hypothetical protein n=1 Tax=Solibacillus sp. CAU 1738 TaxID=3140363 RepID=UPI003260B5DC